MVDLLDGSFSNEISGGVVQLREGTRFYSMFVGVREDNNVSVRISKGEYAVYTRDGRLAYKNADKYVPYECECPMDVVSFSRCAWYDVESMGLVHDYYSAKGIVKGTDGKVRSAIQ